jgi:hypothetical protein
MCSKHLLEVWEAIFKYDEKGRKKGEKARKVTERKKVNMHLLEAVKATYVKEGRARKVTERKMCNMHLLEVGEATFKREKKGRRRGQCRKERWAICIC